MLQSALFFPDYSNDSRARKTAKKELKTGGLPNSLALAEREGVTATSLGRPKGGKAGGLKVIHRVPSIEGATATSLSNFSVSQNRQKISRKNAPNELSLCSSNKTKQGGSHGA